jgi:serine/threonine protein kinase
MRALARQAGLARNLEASDLLEGKYRLERVLGAGAMGRVWLAHNIHLDAPVAIKIVERDTHGAEAMQRVLTEARLEAHLRHPNIVRVLDCHAVDDLSYVVMELLEGCTLGELMDEGPLPPALAVRLMLPLIDGLVAAHRAGVVHRDIKPENVFITRPGERICPKLLDFGIAHVANDQTARKRQQIVGTPGYMAPEQAYGEQDIDGRADIWSLGVVLYEAVSGESAFGCASYRDYLRALNERVLPPLSKACGGDELWQILQRALCPSSVGRFTSCSDFASALQIWLRSRGIQEDLSGDSLSANWAMPGSIIDRAIRRAAAKHADFAERDSYAPTQADMTTRRRRQSERPSTSAVTSTPSHVTTRAPSAPEAVNSRLSTIRTIPQPPAAARRQRWSSYALIAGAAFGVSFALAEMHGDALAAQRPSSLASLQPSASSAPVTPPSPTSVLRSPATDAPQLVLDVPAVALEPSAEPAMPEAKAPQRAASARPKSKPQRSAAAPNGMRKQASALGLKSPW